MVDDNLKVVGYWDVTGMERRGFDLSKKRLFRVELADDARAPDNEGHPMIAVAKIMRSKYGIPLYFSLRGKQEEVEAMQAAFESRAAAEGYIVASMPLGFVAGADRQES